MMNVKKFAIGALALVFTGAMCAKGDMYILGGSINESNVGSSSEPVDWSTPANWTPERVPGAADEINWAPSKTGSHRHAYVSLNGNYAIGSLSTKYRTLHLYRDASAEVSPVVFTINGQLGGDDYQQCHEVNNGAMLVLPVGSTMICSKGGHTHTGLSVLSGGEADIFGSVQSRVMKLDVSTGGVLVFSPSSYTISSWGRSDSDHDEINVGGGTASFPAGILMTGTSSTPNNQFNQSDGTVEFGGDFTSQLGWTYTWSGGTLSVTDNSRFGANIALVIPASAAVSLDVASGKTFSAPGLVADATATITKTGAGTFAYAPTDAAIAVNAGGIGFASASTYDLSNVTFANDTTIDLVAMGATISATSATIDNAMFNADLSNVPAGTVVLNSSDATLLTKAQSDLAGSVAAGFVLLVNGSTLSVEVQSNFNFGGEGDILDGSYWGGSLPPANSEVAITGATTVATLSSGSFPAWTSIEVKDGAVLRIETDAYLVPIVLNKNARLVIASDATVALSNIGDLSGVATAQQVPVLSIEPRAMLNIPGGMKFSNVNIDLKGELAASSGGGVTFGYAGNGDTTYIGLKVDGGTLSLSSSTTNSQYDTEPLEFCCPAVGGTVVAIDDLTFTNATIKPWARTSYPFTEQCEFGFHMGINNPVANHFAVVFDDTAWGASGKTIVKGGATFRLQNGGTYQNAEAKELWNRTAEISESGRVVVAAGGAFRLNAMGEWGNKTLDINPTSANHQAIVVEEGGTFENYCSYGNRNGVFNVGGNANYCVYIPNIHHEGSSETYDTTNTPFAGLASVNIVEDSALTFTTRNRLWTDGMFFDDSGDRVVALADVPITGGGSVALSNANVNVFGVIVKSGANTASGTASVVDPAAGVGATTLYFADGANWAGTVVAGNVALTNLTDGAAVNVDFGALDLAVDFLIRVWTDNGGSIVTNDMLNVGTYDNANGGRLVPISAASGETLAAAGRIVIGKIDKNSPVPTVARGWSARTSDILGDDANYLLTLKPNSGMQIILR